MDSSTTAAGAGSGRASTGDAAPRDTPIAPMRSPGQRRAGHVNAAAAPCDSLAPKVMCGAGLSPWPGRSIASVAMPRRCRNSARATIACRLPRTPCRSSTAPCPGRPGANQPATMPPAEVSKRTGSACSAAGGSPAVRSAGRVMASPRASAPPVQASNAPPAVASITVRRRARAPLSPAPGSSPAASTPSGSSPAACAGNRG
jgi:hypothetical protein